MTERISDELLSDLRNQFEWSNAPPTMLDWLKAERVALKAAEAKLEAVRKLVTDWRIEIPKLLLVGPEAADALESCADELEALLKQIK